MKISSLQQLRCIQKANSRIYFGHFELSSLAVTPAIDDNKQAH